MSRRDILPEHHADTSLEPLENIPFPPPFHTLPHTPRRIPLRLMSALNDTPTSETFSLPTPSRPAGPVLSDIRLPPDNIQPLGHQEPIIEAEDHPPAPVLKDLDSFSQGTGLGSFDFSLHDGYDDLLCPPSVAFSPSHPESSIENWRRDVSRSASSEELDTYEEMRTGVEADFEEAYGSVHTSVPSPGALGLRPKRELSSSSSSVLSFAVKQGAMTTRLGESLETKRRRVEEAEVLEVPNRPSSAPPSA